MTHILLTPAIRDQIEAAAARHFGRAWRVEALEDLHDLSSHPAALLSDGALRVFAKLGTGANAVDQLQVELAGLRRLHEQTGVSVPTPIDVLEIDAQRAVLLLEAVTAVPRNAEQWRDIGRALARIHSVTGAQFGLETHGYFGPVYQDNRPLQTWAEFFAERRLWPRMIAAIDAGHLPIELARGVERIIARLPELCGPAPAPALLHGDAQKNNWISSAQGAVVIDPAVHYGHPEFDLALLGYFEAVPEAVFDGYRELRPIDAGFAERCELWRLAANLAVVTLDASYLDRIAHAVRLYGR
jgi:protein-ribulosamine 3-kinase